MAGAALAVALALPTAAIAATTGNLFADIAGNPFADAINALGGAGITTGCTGGTAPNGNFCPTDTITRQAEAGFVNRGMPRVAMSTTLLSSSVDQMADVPVASVAITVGGTAAYEASAHQFVEVHGHFNFYDSYSTRGCPCNYYAYLTDGTSQSDDVFGIIPSGGLVDFSSGEVTWVFSAAPGTHTYTIYVGIGPGAYTVNLETYGTPLNPVLIASTSPFGDTGFNNLTPQAPSKTSPGKLPKHTIAHPTH